MMCVFYYMTGAAECSPKVILWRSRDSNLLYAISTRIMWSGPFYVISISI